MFPRCRLMIVRTFPHNLKGLNICFLNRCFLLFFWSQADKMWWNIHRTLSSLTPSFLMLVGHISLIISVIILWISESIRFRITRNSWQKNVSSLLILVFSTHYKPSGFNRDSEVNASEFLVNLWEDCFMLDSDVFCIINYLTTQ